MSTTISRSEIREYFNQPIEYSDKDNTLSSEPPAAPVYKQPSYQPPANAIVDGMFAKLSFLQKSDVTQQNSQAAPSPSAKPVTQELLSSISPAFKTLPDANKKAVVDQLNLAMKMAGITNLRDQAMFLAQVAVETGGFTKFSEERSKHSSSKSFYKGRGPLQLTGEDNYMDFAQKLGGVTISKSGIKISTPLAGTDRTTLAEHINKVTDGSIDAKQILERLDKAKEEYVKIDKEFSAAQKSLKDEATQLKKVQRDLSAAANQDLSEAQKMFRSAKQERLKAKTPEEIARADKSLAVAKSRLDAATSNLENLKNNPSIKQAQQRVHYAQQKVSRLKESRDHFIGQLKQANSAWVNVIMRNPKILAKSSYIGSLSAVYVWKEHGIDKILSVRRGDEAEALRAVSGKINRGKESAPTSTIVGFSQRKRYYEKIKQLLGVK